MCKKSVLQNGKLISRACNCFPGEPSYNLRKGEWQQTYSNGARALAMLGSGLARRDKRGSTCPRLGWEPHLCLEKRIGERDYQDSHRHFHSFIAFCI